MKVFPSSKNFIETLLSQIQEDVNMTLRKIADRQEYQNLILKIQNKQKNKIQLVKENGH